MVAGIRTQILLKRCYKSLRSCQEQWCTYLTMSPSRAITRLMIFCSGLLGALKKMGERREGYSISNVLIISIKWRENNLGNRYCLNRQRICYSDQCGILHCVSTKMNHCCQPSFNPHCDDYFTTMK